MLVLWCPHAPCGRCPPRGRGRAWGGPARGRPAARVLEPGPELQRAEELRLVVIELRVRLVGGLLQLERAVANVLHAQRAGDDQHFPQRLAMARLEDHAADARIERQARE